MTDDGVSRRWLLAAAGATGALAGCSGILDDANEPTAAETDTTATTTETTETRTPEPEATIKLVGVALREETVTVGDAIGVEVALRNTGSADGETELSLGIDGDRVRAKRVEVPAGQRVQTTLTGPDTTRTGTVAVSLNDEPVADVTVGPPPVLHVTPDGDDDNPGTEDAPVASIDDAVSRARPGDTVRVHPGQYRQYVEFRDGGEPGAPITLTGPPDAVLKPPREIDHQVISVDASHVHVTGLTVSGLYDPDAPDDPSSYHSGKLVDLNTFPEHGDDYIEGLVVSPHRLGNAGQALVNAQMVRDSEIGGFEVIGPAGARWILDDTPGHNGELVYLGTAPDNRIDKGFEGYDRTRNVRVHHIDNSAGHPHAEMVDCKVGVEDVTVEYCTDGGGAQTHEGPYQRSVSLDGHGCTVRWNVIQNVEGTGVRIGPQSFLSEPGVLGEPQTDRERQMGTEHAIYGNVFTGNTKDAVDFYRESVHPDRESNPGPADQRALCGNLFDGYSDDAPGKSCPAELPSGDGVGHLGGTSPWGGDPPARETVFERDAMAPHLDTTVEAADVPTNTDIEATVTVTNNGDSPAEVVLRLQVDEGVQTAETVSVAGGETREVDLAAGGIPNPDEVAVTRNGQKIGSLRVTESG